MAGRDDMKDLLDNVDLNTYGLRRIALPAETILNNVGFTQSDNWEREDSKLVMICKFIRTLTYRIS